MKAAIVTIGDEILIGQIVDTNSAFMAKALDAIGVETIEMVSVNDTREAIENVLIRFQNKVDLVVLTGGLGPTKDDVTRKVLCDYFNDVFVRDENVETHIIALFEGMNYPVTQINKDQALVPSRAIILPNKFGTAPGMWMQKEKTVFVSLPGVPYEMKGIFELELIPKIVSTYKRPYNFHRTILTQGQGESVVAERIVDWENNLPDFIKLAYLPSPGRVRLRLTTRGFDEERLEKIINDEVKKLTSIIGDIIVSLDENEPIEVVLGRLVKAKKLTIATAESCTGGKIAQLITSVPGASAYFKGSVVSYATETKVNVLRVSTESIAKYSVVSNKVAEEMALGVQKLLKVDYAVATTGNAGPSKGEAEADLGVVCIALATPKEVFSWRYNFGQPREKVIDRAVNKAFELLYKEILKN
jgi:nicotinamide-nucleotide amidase